MDEPQRFGNASEAGLQPSERRDLILATLAIARGIMDHEGRWVSVQEVERLLARYGGPT